MKRAFYIMAIASLLIVCPAYSAPIDLGSVDQADCGSGPSALGDFGSVFGSDLTVISPCWWNNQPGGTDPGLGDNPNADGYLYTGTLFEFIDKAETSNAPPTATAGLQFVIGSGAGTWSIDSDFLEGIDDFMLTFKLGQSLGLWLFEGEVNNSFDNGFYSFLNAAGGTTGDLSNLALYAATETTVPAPAPLALLGIGLMLMSVARRGRKVSRR